jgi:hypothetical protein
LLKAEPVVEPPEINELRAPSVQLIIATTNTAMAGASHCHAGICAAPASTSAFSGEVARPKTLALRAADG